MFQQFAQAANAVENNASGADTNATPGPDSGSQPTNEADPSWVSDLFSRVSDMVDSGAIGLLLEGGFFMWPILIMAIVALAVIIERWRSLKMLNSDTEALRQAVLEDLTNDRVEEALARCDRERGPVAAVLANGLRK